MRDEQLMEDALEQFQHLARPKFQKGIIEHNSDGTRGLDKMTLLQKIDCCKEEVIDLWFYLYAIEQKMLDPNRDD